MPSSSLSPLVPSATVTERASNAPSASPPPITKLPPELVYTILSYLPLHSLLSLESVSTSLRALVLTSSAYLCPHRRDLLDLWYHLTSAPNPTSLLRTSPYLRRAQQQQPPLPPNLYRRLRHTRAEEWPDGFKLWLSEWPRHGRGWVGLPIGFEVSGMDRDTVVVVRYRCERESGSDIVGYFHTGPGEEERVRRIDRIGGGAGRGREREGDEGRGTGEGQGQIRVVSWMRFLWEEVQWGKVVCVEREAGNVGEDGRGQSETGHAFASVAEAGRDAAGGAWCPEHCIGLLNHVLAGR